MNCKKHRKEDELCTYCECDKDNLRTLAGRCVGVAFRIIEISGANGAVEIKEVGLVDSIAKISVQLARAIEKEINR